MVNGLFLPDETIKKDQKTQLDKKYLDCRSDVYGYFARRTSVLPGMSGRYDVIRKGCVCVQYKNHSKKKRYEESPGNGTYLPILFECCKIEG